MGMNKFIFLYIVPRIRYCFCVCIAHNIQVDKSKTAIKHIGGRTEKKQDMKEEFQKYHKEYSTGA